MAIGTVEFLLPQEDTKATVMTRADGRLFVVATESFWVSRWKVIVPKIEVVTTPDVSLFMFSKGKLIGFIPPDATRHYLIIDVNTFFFKHYKTGDVIAEIVPLYSAQPHVFMYTKESLQRKQNHVY